MRNSVPTAESSGVARGLGAPHWGPGPAWSRDPNVLSLILISNDYFPEGGADRVKAADKDVLQIGREASSLILIHTTLLYDN